MADATDTGPESARVEHTEEQLVAAAGVAPPTVVEAIRIDGRAVVVSGRLEAGEEGEVRPARRMRKRPSKPWRRQSILQTLSHRDRQCDFRKARDS